MGTNKNTKLIFSLMSKTGLSLFNLCLLLALATYTLCDDIQGCWKDAYGRGVGKPIHACGAGLTQRGLLCYAGAGLLNPKPLGCAPNEEYDAGLCYSQKCRAGTKAIGPMCWGSCPSGSWDCLGFCTPGGLKACAGHIKDVIHQVVDLAKQAVHTVTHPVDWEQMVDKTADAVGKIPTKKCSRRERRMLRKWDAFWKRK